MGELVHNVLLCRKMGQSCCSDERNLEPHHELSPAPPDFNSEHFSPDAAQARSASSGCGKPVSSSTNGVALRAAAESTLAATVVPAVLNVQADVPAVASAREFTFLVQKYSIQDKLGMDVKHLNG